MRLDVKEGPRAGQGNGGRGPRSGRRRCADSIVIVLDQPVDIDGGPLAGPSGMGWSRKRSGSVSSARVSPSLTLKSLST